MQERPEPELTSYGRLKVYLHYVVKVNVDVIPVCP